MALNRVSLELERGCIHGLIGENGSGKSTLASIIAGVQQATSGKMFLNGDSYNPQSTIDANNHKVCMIVQEQGTFANMSVAANIFIGKENLFFDHGLINVLSLIHIFNGNTSATGAWEHVCAGAYRRYQDAGNIEYSHL